MSDEELIAAARSLISSNQSSAVLTLLALVVMRLERDRWVPVGERLPDEGENVLVWDAYDSPKYGAHLGNYLSSRRFKKWNVGFIRDSDVTHWRPLPAGPTTSPADTVPPSREP